MTNTGTQVRYYGITDDVTTCEHCGREGLKRTVILELLDHDGNGEGVTYYGTSCAARALSARTGRRYTTTEITNAAASAQTRARQDADMAREFFDFYATYLTMGADEYVKAFTWRNGRSGGFHKTLDEWRALAMEVLGDHRAALAAAGIVA